MEVHRLLILPFQRHQTARQRSSPSDQLEHIHQSFWTGTEVRSQLSFTARSAVYLCLRDKVS